MSAKDMTGGILASEYASLMAIRTNRFATALLSACALLCSAAAFAILFFPATTGAVEFASLASPSGSDPNFWLFFALMCGAAFSALAALATWKSRD
jgi:hypothetical protein